MEKNSEKKWDGDEGGHILQSREWQNFEKSEGKEVFECSGKGWRARGVVEKTLAGKYLYTKYGPELNARKDMTEALRGLRDLARKKGAIFVRIEPQERFEETEMKKMGLVRSKELDPEYTWVLDLDREEGEILAGMESNKVRSHRNMAKRGMRVWNTKNPEKIGILAEMLEKVGERDNFTPQDEEHLKKQLEAGFATLYVVEYAAEMEGKGADGRKNEILERKKAEGGDFGGKNGEDEGEHDEYNWRPIAAALVYDYGGVRYYAHAATDENYKKLRAGAVLLVEMILEAKKNGGKRFDFWGITVSEDPAHPWYGFTQFKKSFGGRQVEYSGTYDLVVDKIRYKLYKTLRKANLALRKR